MVFPLHIGVYAVLGVHLAMKHMSASKLIHRRCQSRWFDSVAILGVLCLSLTFSGVAQVNVTTQHNDNSRDGLNANETFLTPVNVNTAQFGKLFTQPVDGLVAAQPLYMSQVTIPGQGIHNVVYVVTLHDSVYAFDADSNMGANAAPLWQVSFLNPAAGITTEPVSELGCGTTTGFTEMGILGTPVIDGNSGTMYLIAKTKENGTYHFHLHALDITTGLEKFAGPIDLSATVTGKAGTLMLLQAGLNMMNRPGLLLSQGIVYFGFGSNGCDGGGTRGWVLAYDATTLMQLGVYNDGIDSPISQGNLWMAGNGLASDDSGNIFFATANGLFDANTGNRDYGSSIMKIGWSGGTLGVEDYFTPYDQFYLQSHDLDVGSAGVTLLPDQPSGPAHLIVGSGKIGDIYLVNRDTSFMGEYNSLNNNQIPQYIPLGVGRMFSTPAYWNGNVYFTGQSQGPSSFSLSNGQLTLLGRSSTTITSPHTPSISANGTTNGILWLPGASKLLAFDATNITKPAIYTGGTGTLAHFNAPTVTNGKVYVGASLQVEVFGLFSNLAAIAGSNQSAPAQTAFPNPLQVLATSPYTGGMPKSGVLVTFSDGGKGGSLNPASAVTDSTGQASTIYTAPKKAGVYTITAKSPGFSVSSFTETVTPGTAAKIVALRGNNQTAPVQTTYTAPLVVAVQDINSNGVSGQTVNFSDNGSGGTFNPPSAVTDVNGKASTLYTTGTKSASLRFTVTSGSLKQAMYGTVTAGPASVVGVVAGNNQTGAVSTTLGTSLVVVVTDQFSNRIPGVSVTFSDGGAGGGFSANPVVTDSTGQAATAYTLPPVRGPVNVSASISGGAAAGFTETAQ